MKKIPLMLAMLLIGCLLASPGSSYSTEQPDPKPQKKRGLKPTPRHVLASAPRFKNGRHAVPAYYFRLPKKLNTWGNDQYGDCVTAESAFNRACAGVFIQEQEVIRWARENGVLNGADLNQVIELQRQKGFSQDGNIYGNGPGSVVNYADAATMKAAIYQAGMDKGCISIGISADMLPSGAGNTNGWFLSGRTNDNSEDHCVSLCGFGTAADFCKAMNAAYSITISPPSGMAPDTQGYALYTWATIGFVETSSCVGMMGEAWIRSPSTIITGTGTPTPDDVYVTADPTPPPPPVPPGPTPTPIPGQVTKIMLSQDMKAGTYEQMPEGTTSDIAVVAQAVAKLTGTVTPPQPPGPGPGGLEARVTAIESTLRDIANTLNLLKKEIGK